jgi:gluconokinase
MRYGMEPAQGRRLASRCYRWGSGNHKKHATATKLAPAPHGRRIRMIVVIMGVAGSGKTLIGQQLAQALDWSFVDADDFHPPENVEKMSSGVPLSDADREPWLEALRRVLSHADASRRNVVLACSALREAFRNRLGAGVTDLHFVYLRGDSSLLEQRLRARRDHFFSPDLLTSQLATLEEPRDAIVVATDALPPAIVARISRELAERARRSG